MVLQTDEHLLVGFYHVRFQEQLMINLKYHKMTSSKTLGSASVITNENVVFVSHNQLLLTDAQK